MNHTDTITLATICLRITGAVHATKLCNHQLALLRIYMNSFLTHYALDAGDVFERDVSSIVSRATFDLTVNLLRFIISMKILSNGTHNSQFLVSTEESNVTTTALDRLTTTTWQHRHRQPQKVWLTSQTQPFPFTFFALTQATHGFIFKNA